MNFMHPFLLVSIICPLYNKHRYIKEAIDSLLAQTYANWEMIIVDDGSTDGSYELAKKLCSSDQRIQLFKRSDFNQEKGGSVCRNIGASLAKGDFFLFLDADDILSTNCLQNRLTKISRDSKYGVFIFRDGTFIGIERATGNKMAYAFEKIRFQLKNKADKRTFLLKKFLKYQTPFQTSASMWKRESFFLLNGFLETFQRLQDIEIHSRLLLSDEIKIICYKFEMEPDVWIRIEKDRHDNIATLVKRNETYIESVIKFGSQIGSLLQDSHYNKYIYCLHGIYFSAFAKLIYERYSASANDKIAFEDQISILKAHVKHVNLPKTVFLLKMISFYEFMAGKKWSRKLKLTGILYRIFPTLLG